jgi:membrane fusion protein (multidrug efflux system)
MWIVIIVIVAAFAIRFMQKTRVESVASMRSVQETEGKPVEVATAVRGNLEAWTTLAGTVEGSMQYAIISTNSIRVTDILKKEGDWVDRGDVVIRLEKTAPNPMLHSYNRSRALYEDALADAKRMRNLYSEGAISKQTLEKAEMALKVAESDLINATESTNLMATHPGIVMSVLVEEGELANSHVPLAWIARTDTVKLAFEAGSRQAMALEVGQKAVWHSRVAGESSVGYIEQLDLAADPENHLLNGKAVFPNPNGRLIPGLLVSFSVRTGDRTEVIKIPSGCLIGENGQYKLFVIETGEDGREFARLREVEVGMLTTDEIEIIAGVGEGDRVVQFGQTLLSDGDLVKIMRGGEGN